MRGTRQIAVLVLMEKRPRGRWAVFAHLAFLVYSSSVSSSCRTGGGHGGYDPFVSGRCGGLRELEPRAAAPSHPFRGADCRPGCSGARGRFTQPPGGARGSLPEPPARRPRGRSQQGRPSALLLRGDRSWVAGVWAALSSLVPSPLPAQRKDSKRPRELPQQPPPHRMEARGRGGVGEPRAGHTSAFIPN